MSDTQNSVFGRKVFFLNPSYKIKNHVIKELRELEYEVYEINNHKYAKNILKHNPDSILFVNTDSQMVLTTWLAFIKSIDENKILKTTKIGILSERISQDDANLIFDMFNIEAGITSLNGDLTKVLDVIKGILDMLDAKGRRKYVRCSCINDKNVQLFWTFNGKMHQFKILDLSSVTVAVRFPNTLNHLATGQLINDAQVVIGTRVIALNLSVYIIKETPNGQVAILLYDEKTSPTLKTKIKEFIAQTLQTQLISCINGEPEDTTDYLFLAKQDQHMLELEIERKKAKKSLDEKHKKLSDENSKDEENKNTESETESTEELSTTESVEENSQDQADDTKPENNEQKDETAESTDKE